MASRDITMNVALWKVARRALPLADQFVPALGRVREGPLAHSASVRHATSALPERAGDLDVASS
jgi:hypothetical protein